MSSMRLAFSSDGRRPLGRMRAGQRGTVDCVCDDVVGLADRLFALGVTPGALVTVLQTFPGIVFLCDQTELAIERGVGDAVIVRVMESR